MNIRRDVVRTVNTTIKELEDAIDTQQQMEQIPDAIKEDIEQFLDSSGFRHGGGFDDKFEDMELSFNDLDGDFITGYGDRVDDCTLFNPEAVIDWLRDNVMWYARGR